jgi:hypothetical protein
MVELTGKIRRVRNSLSSRGVIGTLARIPLKFKWYTPGALRARQKEFADELQFDRDNNVDTAESRPRHGNEMLGNNSKYGVGHFPVNPAEFHSMLESVNVDHRKFTFIDFGAGKGRAMLLAAQYAFGRIVGIEYSKELVGIARKNVNSYTGRCATERKLIEVLWQDVTDFQLPNSPLILYFYNPFGEQIMRKVADNIRCSLTQQPRENFIFYHTPDFAKDWLNAGFACIQAGKGYSIYQWPRQQDVNSEKFSNL